MSRSVRTPFGRPAAAAALGVVLAAGASPIPSRADEPCPATAKIRAPEGSLGDAFGFSLSLSGDTAVIGARDDDRGAMDSGSAHVFPRDPSGAWSPVAVLAADDPATRDFFGHAVSVSGSTALVGVPFDDDAGLTSGSAGVFERDAGGPDAWGHVAKLLASDARAHDELGYSVSLSGDVAVAAAPHVDASATGAAYVFERDAGGPDTWSQVAKLTASDAAAGDQFGHAVSLSADRAVIGAVGTDGAGPNAGSAYVFERASGGAGAWEEVDELAAPDAALGDQAGTSVAVSGPTVLVGVPNDDDDGAESGSALVFECVRCLDADGDGFTTCAGDCDDDDATTHPGAPEECDGQDDDCNGLVDDDGRPPVVRPQLVPAEPLPPLSASSSCSAPSSLLVRVECGVLETPDNRQERAYWSRDRQATLGALARALRDG